MPSGSSLLWFCFNSAYFMVDGYFPDCCFWLDVAFIIIIPVYTFIFNWSFDKLFGLPISAQAKALAE